MRSAAGSLGVATVVGLTASAGCSLLAPSDDELLGGSSVGGASAGGSGGGATGGATADGGLGGAGSGGVAAGGVGGATGGSGGLPLDGGGGSAGAAGADGGSCSAGTTLATALPLGLYVVLDRTSSMFQNQRFAYSADALQEFSALPTSAGTRMAFQLGPPPLGFGQSCSGNGYSSPDVPMTQLPGGFGAIQSQLNSATPSTLLPLFMQGALLGATQYAKTQATAGVMQTSVVVITNWTNQSSESCQKANQDVTAAALVGEPYVLTWFITMTGQSQDSLNQEALSGGTSAPIPGTNKATVLAALTRASARCRFEVPASAAGGQVQLRPAASAGQPYGQVQDLAACTPSSVQHWFRDAEVMVLCPAACAALTSPLPFEVVTTCS